MYGQLIHWELWQFSHPKKNEEFFKKLVLTNFSLRNQLIWTILYGTYGIFTWPHYHFWHWN